MILKSELRTMKKGTGTDTDTETQTQTQGNRHTNRQTRGEGRGRINILTGTSNVVGKKSHLKFVSQGNTNLFIKDQCLTTTMYTMHTTFFSFWLKYANYSKSSANFHVFVKFSPVIDATGRHFY